MRKGIGAASDYYRLRLLHVDESDEPDLDWREDILWRRPPTQHIEEYELYRIEVLALESDDVVTVIGVFDSPADAHEALSAADEDLAQLTRSLFEERYFPADV